MQSCKKIIHIAIALFAIGAMQATHTSFRNHHKKPLVVIGGAFGLTTGVVLYIGGQILPASIWTKLGGAVTTIASGAAATQAARFKAVLGMASLNCLLLAHSANNVAYNNYISSAAISPSAELIAHIKAGNQVLHEEPFHSLTSFAAGATLGYTTSAALHYAAKRLYQWAKDKYLQ